MAPGAAPATPIQTFVAQTTIAEERPPAPIRGSSTATLSGCEPKTPGYAFPNFHLEARRFSWKAAMRTRNSVRFHSIELYRCQLPFRIKLQPVIDYDCPTFFHGQIRIDSFHHLPRLRLRCIGTASSI